MSTGPMKFDAIIVDPDIDTRMRLKQATASVHQFGKVYQSNSLRDSLSRLETGERIDVCFISYKFDQSEVTSFIKEFKASKGGQDTAYVLVLRSKDQQSSTVAANVIAGYDGFLFEPYSIEQLVELTVLADKVRRERSAAREQAALKFLIHDIVNQIDQIAYLKAAGMEMGPSWKKLREICGVLGGLEPASRDVYFNLAVDTFEAAPMPKRIFQRKIYGGASSRIKKRQEQAILSAIEKESLKSP